MIEISLMDTSFIETKWRAEKLLVLFDISFLFKLMFWTAFEKISRDTQFFASFALGWMNIDL